MILSFHKDLWSARYVQSTGLDAGDPVGPNRRQLCPPGAPRALAQGLAHNEVQQVIATYDDHLGILPVS